MSAVAVTICVLIADEQTYLGSKWKTYPTSGAESAAPFSTAPEIWLQTVNTAES